jgi:hypothetical protein
MKRDMDLIRSILIKVESCEDPSGLQRMPAVEGHDGAEVSYHMTLLHEAGLVRALVLDSQGAPYPDFLQINLTWGGQDFLDAARDNSVWNKAKDSILKPGASFTFDLLLSYLKQKAKEKFGL